MSELIASKVPGRWQVSALQASSFCQTYRAKAPGQPDLFVKAMPTSERGDVLAAEADGLSAIAATATIRVPRLVAVYEAEAWSVLALEWLPLSGAGGPEFGERFGHALASLHALAPPGDGRYGWHRNNWLGSTPQDNAWSVVGGREGWLDFLANQRLLPMANGLGAELIGAVGRVVHEVLPRLFDIDDYEPRASLIHGDLWSGNWSAVGGEAESANAGQPVVFDPAVSVSDPEAELAMMELFGLPPSGFWSAYGEVLPVAEGYAQRKRVYQLVHLLNHARLFGGGYDTQCLMLARRIVESCR
ncbi:fructosamine kinase family protein [Hydrogenophaga sp. 5NK40-0174]|uniref:fructosamine kinase family protein n=1 Tax=Hydrogenophaga sp. 5NK40-0174 TaxID=3127649 RepID=UPI00333FAC75